MQCGGIATNSLVTKVQ